MLRCSSNIVVSFAINLSTWVFFFFFTGLENLIFRVTLILAMLFRFMFIIKSNFLHRYFIRGQFFYCLSIRNHVSFFYNYFLQNNIKILNYISLKLNLRCSFFTRVFWMLIVLCKLYISAGKEIYLFRFIYFYKLLFLARSGRFHKNWSGNYLFICKRKYFFQFIKSLIRFS